MTPKYYLMPIEPEQIHIFLTHANIHQIHASMLPRACTIRAQFPLVQRFGDQIIPCDQKTTVWHLALPKTAA